MKKVKQNKQAAWEFIDYFKEEEQKRSDLFYMGMTSLVLNK